MSALSNLNKGTDVQEVASDVTSGALDTGIYKGILNIAYLTQSEGGATAVNLQFTSETGINYRQTIYISNKAGDLFYKDKRSGKNMPLPGYSIVNNICLLATGKGLTELDDEAKMVNVYNFDLRKDVPTSVPVITDLINKPITLAIQKQIVDKNIKNDAGIYVPSGETREENEIVNSFQAETNLSVDEIKAEVDTAEFMDKWESKNKGKVRNRAKGATSTGSKQGVPKAATPNLFSEQN